MPVSPPTTLYPAFESSWLAGKEPVPATAATAFTGIPTGIMTTDNKFTPLEDMNLRGSNVKVFGLQYGSRHGELTIPESPCYGDTVGIPLLSCLGDYYSTGTAGTPTWTTSSALSPGAGPIPVTSGSVAVSGTYIQIDSSTNSEVVEVGTGSTATSIVVNAATPIRFSHLTDIAITTVTGPYTHNFSLLNGNSSTGNTSAQPPSYTLLHRNFLAGSPYYADQYLYSHFNSLRFQAKKDGFFVWDGKVTSYSKSTPASNITPSFSTVTALPSWQSTISLAGSQVLNVTDLTISLDRELDIVPTADGAQDPYVIGMGPLTATFQIDFDVIANETILGYLTANTQPTFSWTISNGLTGTNEISFAIAAQLAGFKSVPLTPQKSFWGWKAAGDLIASTQNAGNSGGYSPVAVTLINQTPTYDAMGGMVNEGLSYRHMHLI
jgi:Phage tail tube protein